MLLYIILFFSFITFLVIFKILLEYVFRNKVTMGRRLGSLSKQGLKNEDNELNQPLFSRIFKPLLDGLSSSVLKVTPKEMISAFEKKIVTAGSPYKLSVRDWINFQITAALSLPLITVTICYYKNVEPRYVLFLSVTEIGLGLIMPHLILNNHAVERQKKVTNSLPDVIDLLTVSVEAGLGFDGALAKVIDKMPGPLAVEFDYVLQEIKIGKQKRDALRDMIERVNVPDLATFVGSVIQADQFGVGIGNVLRIQSEQMRQKRRQRAQEKAMKAPVKMLIPMILFIFPTIFSVLIGPIAIRVIEVFKK